MCESIKINTEINCHTSLQENKVSKNIISIGKINSAEESPNHIPLRARPLLLLKYLDIVVEEVCDIRPCPENLIKKIAITNK